MPDGDLHRGDPRGESHGDPHGAQHEGRAPVIFDLASAGTIFLAGHLGMVGRAVHRALVARGLGDRVITRTRRQLDLRDQAAVNDLFDRERPDVVILAAAKVGGILANVSAPAEFLYDNLAIASNVIHAAHRSGVRKLVNLGSSCIYPREAPQPIAEASLWTGPLEATNRAYAVAKIAAIEACDAYRAQYGADFVSVMPTNLYGPFDDVDLRTSHVLPALLQKAHEAKVRGDAEMVVWGSGTPRREFLYVDDVADAIVFVLERVSVAGPINVGSGVDLSIRELAALIADVVGFEGAMSFDASKPDGTPRKLLDVSRLAALGWTATVPLREGIERTYAWMLQERTP